MSSKTTPVLASPIHPLPVGTLIDGGSLKLVEVLGVGRYSVVYHAVDTRHPSRSYAVKCLVASEHQSTRPRQRQIHIREIALHQLASAHPGVVTLHRVIEQDNHTYIVMDYAPGHDLCTQILHNCRYLGKDKLIRDVFLQLLDAVQYYHSLGIYHRDLKPENILCFDDGLLVAITDFGLATTNKVSDEFRTGSVYYMSPESQGGRSAPTGNYSPMSNDIWSLGIILLNLATGRHPWKSATPSDPTFQAYLRDPVGFLPTVLPISPEVNNILVRMLDVDWRERINLREVRYAVEQVSSFYSDGVIFEGSMSRCPWESGMDIDSTSSGSNVESGPVSPPAQPSLHVDDPPPLSSHWSEDSTDDIVFRHFPMSFKAPPVVAPLTHPPVEIHVDDPVPLSSHWSEDSTDDIVFTPSALDVGLSYYDYPWTTSSGGATWAFESPISSNPDNEHEHEHFRMELFEHSQTPPSVQTAETSPNTTDSLEVEIGSRTLKPDLHSSLMISTNDSRSRISGGAQPAGRNAVAASYNLPFAWGKSPSPPPQSPKGVGAALHGEDDGRRAISPHMQRSSFPPISTGRPTSSITSYYVPSVIDWTENGNYNLAAAALANESIRSYSTTSTISTDYGSVFFARSLRGSSTSLLGSFKLRSLLRSR